MTITAAAAEPEFENHVVLRGRLAGSPSFRELPSGDVLAVFRLVVPRPPTDRVRVDTLECLSGVPKVHKALHRAEAGVQIQVCGSLRRRFWRTPSGPASRYAVEVATIKVIRLGRRGGASRGRTRVSA